MGNARKNIFNLIEAATKELSVEDQFLNDLNFTIEKIDENNKRLPSSSYKPSSMQCVRNMYYQIIKAEGDVERKNADFIGILHSGTDRHERIQEAISLMTDFNIDCEYIDVETFINQRNLDYLEIVEKQGYETKVRHKDLNIRFLCDGIIKYKSRYYILEIKTETMYKFQSRQNVAPEHYAQAATYSICFGIDDVLFLYENRDNCSKKIYLLEVTDDMKFDLVLSKIEECEYNLSKLTVPTLPKDFDDRICRYCGYKKQCAKDGK